MSGPITAIVSRESHHGYFCVCVRVGSKSIIINRYSAPQLAQRHADQINNALYRPAKMSEK